MGSTEQKLKVEETAQAEWKDAHQVARFMTQGGDFARGMGDGV